MWFKLHSEISDEEVIAAGKAIRELRRLERVYGRGDGTSSKELPLWSCPTGPFLVLRCTGMRRTATVVRN
jgi:hypothetical protein